METSRMKPGFNGVGVDVGMGSVNGSSRRPGPGYGYYMGSGAAGRAAPPVDGCSVALRVFVLASTLVSAVVMGADRQTRTIQIAITDALPPLELPLTAKWSYSSAFVRWKLGETPLRAPSFFFPDPVRRPPAPTAPNRRPRQSPPAPSSSPLPRAKSSPAAPSRQIVSPPLMWAEALNLLLGRLRSRANLRRVAAVSGSAQQHGSVYWAKGALDPAAAEDLAPQLASAGALAAPESPVWMDSSTAAQCREVEAAMGGPLRLARLTGCRAHRRCTGPQIRKMHQRRPQVYAATERVSLVSSFMASLLVGGYACIDETDGAGMNIMDIDTRQLLQDALQVLFKSDSEF